MSMHRMNTAIAIGAACMLLPAAARAQAISSPDGEWRATLDAAGHGQITNLFNADGSTDNLFETLWYEVSDTTGGVSSRIETNWTVSDSSNDASSATFSATRNAGGMTMDGTLTMLDGEAEGGALYSFTFTNTGTEAEEFNVYLYVDLDVSASAGGDAAMFDTEANAVAQSDATTIFFGSTDAYASYEINTFAGLRTALDAGLDSLSDSGDNPGPADLTCALSGVGDILAPGESFNITLGIGGEIQGGGCAPDWNGDGELNSDDFFDFIDDFLNSGDADYNGDGETNSDDFFDFIGDFLFPPNGC